MTLPKKEDYIFYQGEKFQVGNKIGTAIFSLGNDSVLYLKGRF